MRPRIFHFLLSLPALSVALKAQPVEFSFTPSIVSGAFIGQIEADGAPAEAGSWIAAFGTDGHCVGASGLISFNGLSYANLNIYGDDPNTADVDEGLLPGDFFTLKLYLPSSGDIVDHTFEGAPIQLSGWINNYGAPIPGYDGQNAVYNFITTPPPLSYTVSSTEPDCHDSANGQISLIASGGLLPLSYLWNTGAGESSLTGLAAGTYACTITDAAGMGLVTEPIILEAPPALTVETTAGVDSCAAGTGSATALVSGGTTPYTYAWSTGQPTAAIEQLEAGVYALTVSDANGCETVASAEVSPSPAFSVSVSLIGASCFGASDANGCTQTGTVTVGLATGATEAHREKPLVEVFPNPATGNIAYLKVEGTAKSITEIRIRGLDGQHIARLAIQPGQRLQFWAGGLKPGAYLLELPELPGARPVFFIKN